MISREQLIACCGLGNDEQLRKEHTLWVEASLLTGYNTRKPEWTESIAVGSEKFVQEILEKLAPRVPDRKVRKLTDYYELKEQGGIYNAHFGPKNAALSIENVFDSGLNDL